MMRYYLNVEPETLSDEDWAMTYRQLADIRQKESRGS
jgi:hypothetical protein